ncbi:hypothetical protein CDAR_540051 [Caerostris darwini]|uniref:Uncharacterized protein n=1 Tax=Caerostris darwini TaxID=1538125 RepID=A0AAV4TLD3_9ARAC|nr:hypothetical protein CDAR_540051 [Caerostris darwini]
MKKTNVRNLFPRGSLRRCCITRPNNRTHTNSNALGDFHETEQDQNVQHATPDRFLGNHNPPPSLSPGDEHSVVIHMQMVISRNLFSYHPDTMTSTDAHSRLTKKSIVRLIYSLFLVLIISE